jgi:hypothetical protein
MLKIGLAFGEKIPYDACVALGPRTAAGINQSDHIVS